MGAPWVKPVYDEGMFGHPQDTYKATCPGDESPFWSVDRKHNR